MAGRNFQLGGLPCVGVIAMHVLVLLAAVAAPVYALGDALAALLNPAPGENLAVLVDLTRWRLLLTNTAVVCGVAVTTALTAGALLGLLATRTDLPGRRLLIGAALFGACLPIYVSTIFFLSLTAISTLTGSSVASGLLYGLAYTPLATLALAAAYSSADRGLEDQALLDAGPARVLWRVTVPLAGWSLIVTGMIVVLLVATDYTVTDLLQVRTFAEECYTQYQLAARRVVPLLTALPALVVLAGLLVVVQVRYRLLDEHNPWRLGERPRVFALGRWRRWAGAACGVLLAAGLIVPVVGLARAAIGTVMTPADVARALARIGTDVVGLLPELRTSAMLAISGATLIVLPGVGLATVMARGDRTSWLTSAAVVLLLAAPAPVVGISLIGLLNRPGLSVVYDSSAVVVVGYFVRFLPVAVLLLVPAVRRTPTELVAAARIDGCDWLGVQWHVYWPTVVRDAAVVWLVIVVLCYGEFGATCLVAPPGCLLSSQEAFQFMHQGVYRPLAALALVSVGFVVGPWAVLLWLLRRALRGARALP
jgi:iron(III) transport system permease protein